MEQPRSRPPSLSRSRSGTPQYDDSENEHNPALEHDRRLNNNRLKSRFEEIFSKYGKDFTGVGDEIDLATGDIVVDNGHLERMQHEADPGHSESSQFVRAFAENLEHEDEQHGEEQDVEDYSVLEEDSDNGASEGEEGFETAVSSREETPSMLQPNHISRRVSEDTGSLSAVSVNMDDAMPGLSESMQVLQAQMLQPQAGTGQSINADAIQALGVSIAKQLAQLMGTSSKAKGDSTTRSKRKDPVWDYPELPQDKRQRLHSPSHRVETRQLAAPLPMSPKARASLWAPVQHPRQNKRKSQAPKNNLLLAVAAAPDTSAADDDTSVEDQSPVSNGPKICANCGTDTTPHWRVGPEKQDWCNFCASYEYRYGGPPPQADSDEEIDEDLETDEEANEASTIRNIREYSTEEDATIIKLKEIDGKKWREIAPLLGEKRSQFAIQARYSKYLYNQACAGRTTLIERGYICHDNAMEPRIGGFTDTENEVILYLREKTDLDWTEIAKRIPDSTAETVESRYQLLEDLRYIEENPSIAKEIMQEAEKPSHKAGVKDEHDLMPKINTEGIEANSPDEDRLVIQLREVHGLTWDQIHDRLPCRNLATIRRRYAHNLPKRKLDYEAMNGKGTWETRDVYTGEFVNCAAGSAPGTNIEPNIQIIPERIPQTVETNVRRSNSQLEQPGSHPHRTLDLLKDGWQIAGSDESTGAYGTFKLRMPKRRANGPNSSRKVSRQLELQSARQGANALLAPEVPKRRYGTDFTEEEDRLLIKLHFDQGLSCTEISEKHMPHRSAVRLNARWRSLRRGYSENDPVKVIKSSNHMQTSLLRQVLDTTVEYSLANSPVGPMNFHELLSTGQKHYQRASSHGRSSLGGNMSSGTKENPLCLDLAEHDISSPTNSRAGQAEQIGRMIHTPSAGSAPTSIRRADGALNASSSSRQPVVAWPPSNLAPGHKQGQRQGQLPLSNLANQTQQPLYVHAHNHPLYSSHGQSPIGRQASHPIQPPHVSPPNQSSRLHPTPPRIPVPGGTWVMIPDTDDETFDKAYVRAHPEEDFYHTGNGIYKRGDAHETFSKLYVLSHPHEQFYHSGKGYYKRGVRPTLAGAPQATENVQRSQQSLPKVTRPEASRSSVNTSAAHAGKPSPPLPGPGPHPITTVPRIPKGHTQKENSVSVADRRSNAQHAIKRTNTSSSDRTSTTSINKAVVRKLAPKSVPRTVGRTVHAETPPSASTGPSDHSNKTQSPPANLDLDDVGAEDEFTISIDDTTPERRTPELDGDEADDETPPTTPANLYITPARYNQQSQPYYLAPPSDLYNPQSQKIPPEADLAQKEVAIDPSLFLSVKPRQSESVVKRNESIPEKTQPTAIKPTKPAVPRRSLGELVQTDKSGTSTLIDDESPLAKDVSQTIRVSPRTIVSTSPANHNMSSEDELLSSPQKREAKALQRPAHKFKDLISMALNSSVDKQMASRDIVKFVEDNFEYYRENKSGWRESLRGALSNSKTFERITSDFTSVWGFAKVFKGPKLSVAQSSSLQQRRVQPPTTFVEVQFTEGVYTGDEDDDDDDELADSQMADAPPASWPTTIRDSQDSNEEISPLPSTQKSKAMASIKSIDLTATDDSDMEDEDLELRRRTARRNRRAQSDHETSEDDNYVDLTASDEETADELMELSSPAPVRKTSKGPTRATKPFPKLSSDITRDPKSSPAPRTAKPNTSSATKPQSLPRLPPQKHATNSHSSPFPKTKTTSNLNTYGKTKTLKTVSKPKPQKTPSVPKRAKSVSRRSVAASAGFTPISRSSSVVNLPGSIRRIIPLQRGFGEDDDTSEDELA